MVHLIDDGALRGACLFMAARPLYSRIYAPKFSPPPVRFFLLFGRVFLCVLSPRPVRCVLWSRGCIVCTHFGVVSSRVSPSPHPPPFPPLARVLHDH